MNLNPSFSIIDLNEVKNTSKNLQNQQIITHKRHKKRESNSKQLDLADTHLNITDLDKISTTK